MKPKCLCDGRKHRIVDDHEREDEREALCAHCRLIGCQERRDRRG